MKRSAPAWVGPVSAGTGAVMIGLALMIPLIVPANQQFEVLIITFWFGLLGALLLNSAGAYARPPRPSKARILIGIGLAVVGGLTPFGRLGDTPDQRFYLMMALGPIAIAGVLVAGANWPRLAVDADDEDVVLPAPVAPLPRRAPVARVPENTLYRWIVPAALALMMVTILVVVITVVAPALLLLLR